MQLYDYQKTGIENIRNAYKKGKKSPLYVLPTGGGKTFTFSYIAKNAANKGKTVLILVHRVELLRQTSKSLKKIGSKHGLINPKFTPDKTANIQIASVQTLVNRLDKITPPDLIIIDECHHSLAGSWRKVIDFFENAKILGVTATPCRGDGRGLGTIAGGVFDCLIEGPQIYELIDRGFLTPAKVYAPKSNIDLSGVRKSMGDYNKKDLNDVMDKPTITGDAVKHYQKHCSGVPAVAFCVSVKHAEHVAQQFRHAGYRAYSVDGNLDDDERNKRLDGLGNGSIDIITSCDLISEGTDIPSIGCAILLRPTQSLGLYIQQGGRALRISKNKKFSIILDHVGNTLKHGMLDDHREWSLGGRKRKSGKKKEEEESDINVRQCMECFAVFKPAPICPECGTKVKIQERTPEEVDGELEEIKREQVRKEKRKEEGVAGSFNDLARIAKERNYKPRWAYNRWLFKKIY